MKSHGGIRQLGKRLQEPLDAESREAGDAILADDPREADAETEADEAGREDTDNEGDTI